MMCPLNTRLANHNETCAPSPYQNSGKAKAKNSRTRISSKMRRMKRRTTTGLARRRDDFRLWWVVAIVGGRWTCLVTRGGCVNMMGRGQRMKSAHFGGKRRIDTLVALDLGGCRRFGFGFFCGVS